MEFPGKHVQLRMVCVAAMIAGALVGPADLTFGPVGKGIGDAARIDMPISLSVDATVDTGFLQVHQGMLLLRQASAVSMPCCEKPYGSYRANWYPWLSPKTS